MRDGYYATTKIGRTQYLEAADQTNGRFELDGAYTT